MQEIYQVFQRCRIASTFILLHALAVVLLALVAPSVFAATAPVGTVPGSFDVDQNGGARYDIPIVVPPGTAGMAPRLALSYTRAVDNPLAGFGFHVSGLSVVARCGRTVALDAVKSGVNYDNNDRFCLDGQRLVGAPATYGSDASEYKTQRESFGKITSHGRQGNGPLYFKVILRDGVVMEYGSTADARVEATGRSEVRVWALNEIRDRHDNAIRISYAKDAGTGEYRPTRIDYTYNVPAGLTPYNSVLFVYENSPAEIPRYQAGSVIRITKRLTNIQTFAGTQMQLVRDYRLTYGTRGSRSLLSTVSECGSDGVCRAMALEWSHQGGGIAGPVGAGEEGRFLGFATTVTTFGSGGSPTDRWVLSADVNFDGRADLIRYEPASDNAYVAFSMGDGMFESPQVTAGFAPGGGSPSNRWVFTGDPDADGRADLIHYNPADGTITVGLTHDTSLPESQGKFTRQSVSTGFVTGGSPDDRWVFPADVNGDGRTDVVRYAPSEGSIAVGLAGTTASYLGNVFFSAPVMTTGFVTGGGPIHYWAMPADINGDGLTDIVHYNGSSGAITAALSLGNGRFGGQMVSAVRLKGDEPLLTTPGENWVMAADVNGDGLMDLVRVAWNRVAYAALSRGDGTFAPSPRTFIGGVCATPARCSVDVSDVSGDGYADLLRYNRETGELQVNLSRGDGTYGEIITTNGFGPGGSPSANWFLTADFNGDGRTDVIRYAPGGTGMVTTGAGAGPLLDHLAGIFTPINGGLIGPRIDISYKPLADRSVYTRTFRGQIHPIQAVINTMHLVARVAYSDGLNGNYSVRHQYQDAATNLADGGWIGFSWQIETDERTGIRSRTWSRPDIVELANMPLGSDTTTRDGVLLKVEYNNYGGTYKLANGGTAFLIKSTVTETFDLNGVQTSCVRADHTYRAFTAAGNYADFGMPQKTVVKTDKTCSFTSAFVKTTTNAYQHDTANWVLGLVTRTSVLHQAPGETDVTRTSIMSYNDKGALTSETIEPDDAALWLRTQYGYDSFGNRTSATVTGPDITSRTATTIFDSRGQFAVNAINALGQRAPLDTAYDPRTGAPFTQTDLNGLSVAMAYDGFGRKITELRPDNTTTTITYAACGSANPCAMVDNSLGPRYTVTTQSSGVAPAKSYFDVLGRVIRTETQSLNGSTVYQDTEYDALGRVARTSLPYFVGGTVRWNVPTYDILGRVVVMTEADGGFTKTTYNGLTTTVEVSGPDIVTRSRTVVSNSVGQQISATDSLYPTQPTTHRFDAAGNLTQITDSAGNVTTMTYDVRGRKKSMSDPDMGNWSYTYNSLGELVSQTDAKQQVQRVSYDDLGRLATRTTLEGTSKWTYDSAANGIGKPASMTGPNGYQQSYNYDTLGRPSQTRTVIDAETFVFTTSYDSLGRLATTTYPQTGFAVKHVYNARGHLVELRNNSTNALFWQANNADEQGHLTQETLGNNLVARRTYDAAKGTLRGIRTTGSVGTVQDLTYEFDILGNLLTRHDALRNLGEVFNYDTLNRLTNVGGPAPKTFQYDVIGNLSSKSDVGSYAYGAGNAGPHAVTATNGAVNDSYTYDSNGNMLTGAGRTISYTSFNKPSQITRGSMSVTFAYGADFSRIKKVTPTSTTIYVGPYQRATVNGVVEHRHFVGAGGATIVYTARSSGYHDMRYLLTDHLGSTDTVTSESGSIVQQLSYDALGKRRNSDWTDASGVIAAPSTQGFTGHEMDDEIDLVNMNARLYDPMLGRFITSDTIVEGATGQGLNRYTYVQNNPLSLTDPTGHWSLRKAFKSAVRATFWPSPRNVARGIADQPFQRQIDRQIMNNKSLYAAGQWAASYFTAFCGGCGGAAFSAYYTYQATGSLNAVARSAAISYVSSQATTQLMGGPSSGGSLGAAMMRGAISGGVSGAISAGLSGDSMRAGFRHGVAGGALSAGATWGAQAYAASQAGVPIPPEMIEKLKPLVAGLNIDLSAVRVHQGIPWFISSRADGFTFGNDIYMTPGLFHPDSLPIFLTAEFMHELTHVSQFQQSGIFNVATDYIGQYISGRIGGLDHYDAYANISYERSAVAIEQLMAPMRARILRDMGEW